MNITQIADGETVRIIETHGGQAALQKLHSIGIVPGKKVGKVSSSMMKGPIVLNIGTMQVAIGHGMAKKIIVEPLLTDKP
jgi:ferrous iron transport protein A